MSEGFWKKLLMIAIYSLAILFFDVKSLFSVDLFYLPAEPLGPSSRNTGITISEIMYNYGYRPDNRIIEYIEFYNSNPYPEDLTGYKISGIIDYTFPSNTIIGSRQFLVLARSATDIQAVYGLTENVLSYGGTIYRTNVVSGVTNIIQEPITISGTGTIQLKDRTGRVLLSVKFSNNEPWPVAADGTGHSLVLARPSYGENDYRAWTVSDYIGGSPGRGDGFGSETISPVVINEVCANPASSEKFIEIYNRSGNPIDISNYGITDDPKKIKYKIPKTVYIVGYGRYSFPASMLGFSPATMGETIYLFNPAGTRVFDAVKYAPHPAGMSWGRYPDGAEGIFLLSAQSSGSPNARYYRPDVIINEIMYAPISGNSDDEFIELYNRGTNTINLGGWQVQGGVNFLFSTNTVIPPDGYIVVARNMTNLLERYGKSAALCCGKMVGNYTGSLSDKGEKVELAMPFTVVTIDQSGNYKTNNVTVPVDEVNYGIGGDWGKWSRGGGSSLELIDPHSNGRQPMNWRDSVTYTNTSWKWESISLQLEKGIGPIDRIQVYLRDAGECLIDDLEVFLLPYNVNVMSNSYFETGLNGWKISGNHSKSYLSNDGYQGTKCLHLISDGRGDILDNNVSGFFTTTLSPDAMINIKARVRWLSGNTNLVIRLIGNYAEFRIGINPGVGQGTPGYKNSQFTGNNGPSITKVAHYPSLPQANNNVIVQANVNDPDGIYSVSLYYRIDPSTNYNIVQMFDNGIGGDKYANDGIYTGVIPGQSSNTIVAFYIVAADLSSNRISSIYPNKGYGYECLIRFGDSQITNSMFGNYNIWMTSSNYNIFTNINPLSRKEIPVTFVYNNRIIYGATLSYSGEIDFDQSGNPIPNRNSYTIKFPEDNLFLGNNIMEKLRSPGDLPDDDTTLIRNLYANLLAKYINQPYNNIRLVRLKLNGTSNGNVLWEDSQEPDDNYCISAYNSSTMHLFYAKPWIEYKGDMLTNYGWAFLNNRTNIYGEQDPREYSVNWNLEYPYSQDLMFSAYYKIIKLLDTKYDINYDLILNDYINIDQWAKYFALQKFIGNEQFIGGTRSFNAYLFLPDGKKWEILQRNYNSSFGSVNSIPADYNNIYIFNTNDVGLSNLLSLDSFIRKYSQYLYDIAINISPKMDSIISYFESTFSNENITQTTIPQLKNWINSRRNTIVYNSSNQTNISFTVYLPTLLYTNAYFINVSGSGPTTMAGLLVNSINHNILWLNKTNWNTYIKLKPGTNILIFEAITLLGNTLPGARFQSTVITPVSGIDTNGSIILWDKYFTNDFPQLRITKPVVINEIMYNSADMGGDYIELFNPNTNIYVDLSGVQIKGIGYSFPNGTVIKPLSYLLVVEDINVFKSKYGDNLPVIGQYSGNLNNIGEKISLVLTDKNDGTEYIIDSVRYEAQPPYPLQANGLGPSLQLINPYEDTSRIANWTAIDATITPELPVATPGTTNSVIDLTLSIPKLFINEIQANNLTGITNSLGLRTGWIEILNVENSNILLNNYYLSDDYTDLLKWKFPNNKEAAVMKPILIYADGLTNINNGELHSNFIMPLNSGSVYLSRLIDGKIQIVDFISYNRLPADLSYGSNPDGQCLNRQVFDNPTPGLLNETNKTPIKVFINEWMASNISAYQDKVDGDYEDWFELYNMSYSDVDISGFYLTDNLTNKNQFKIPNGTIIPARGFLIVWADGESWQNIPGSSEIHANFTLSKNGELIALYSPDLNLIDSVTFGQQYDNVSQGRFPDGSTNIVFMNIFTPGAPNMVDASISKIDPIPVNPGGIVYLIMGVSDVITNLVRFEPGDQFSSNAYLDNDRGIFIWTVPTNQPIGQFKFSIKVCDQRPGANIINVLFTINVVPPIAIDIQKDLRLRTITLKWNSFTQQLYKIQYKNDLNEPEWSNWQYISPNSNITTIIIPMTNQSRYYRVISD